MSGLAAWAPATWRVHILFASFLAMVAVGFGARRSGMVTTKDMEGMRKFVFGIGLPALLMGSTWRMPVTMDILVGIPWCFLLHVVWAILACLVHRFRDPEKRPWFVLTSQGVFLGYVYPFVATAPPEIAARIVGPALVWDLGGNMWMCLLWQEFIVGRLHRMVLLKNRCSDQNVMSSTVVGSPAQDEGSPSPDQNMDAHVDNEEGMLLRKKSIMGEIIEDKAVMGSRERSHSFSGDTRSGEVLKRHLKNNHMSVEELDALILEWLPPRFFDPSSQQGRNAADEMRVLEVDGIPGRNELIDDIPGSPDAFEPVTLDIDVAPPVPLVSRCWAFVVVIVRSLARPIPAAALCGLALNAAGVPLHPWVGSFLDAYGSTFTPLMFGVMGSFLRLEPSQFSRDVAHALASRVTICVVMSSVLFILPVDVFTRFTWMLSIWSPMTSFVIVLTFKFGFDETRSVCASLLSQLVSFLAMWVITVVALPAAI